MKGIYLALAIVLLGACASQNPETLVVREAWQGDHCPLAIPGPHPSVRWYPSVTNLASRQGGPAILNGARIEDPDSLLLLVYSGTQPSSGYGLSLQDWRRDKGLTLVLQARRPQPGQMSAQVITQPCILLEVGGIKGPLPVTLVDSRGKKLASRAKGS